MKITRQHAIAFSAGLLAITFLTATGCQKQEAPPAAPTSAPAAAAKAAPAERPSAEKNSFHEVTSQLDPGGSLFVYLGTEQWLDGLSKTIGGYRGAIDSFPLPSAKDKENLLRVFDMVTNLVKDSGIEDVSGFGMSSIAREVGFYHSKFILHHYKGRGDGYLWSMFGKKSHPLEGLNWLPDTTSLAAFGDLDLSVLWNAINAQVGKLGAPEANAGLAEATAKFAEATGLKLDQVLASLGNEYGFALTLDESNKVTIPLGPASMTIPNPGLLLAIRVKDDVIFNRVDELLKGNPMVVSSEKDGAKLKTFQIPLPLPVKLSPTLARVGDYLFVASSDNLINEILEVKAGKKPGLKSTTEFKRLSAEIPEEGNAFGFVSKRFGETFLKIEADMMAKNPQLGAQADFMKKFMDSNKVGEVYAVRSIGDEGMVSTINGNKDQAKMILLMPVAVVAVGAAVALPALAKAKAKAQSMSH